MGNTESRNGIQRELEKKMSCADKSYTKLMEAIDHIQSQARQLEKYFSGYPNGSKELECVDNLEECKGMSLSFLHLTEGVFSTQRGETTENIMSFFHFIKDVLGKYNHPDFSLYLEIDEYKKKSHVDPKLENTLYTQKKQLENQLETLKKEIHVLQTRIESNDKIEKSLRQQLKQIDRSEQRFKAYELENNEAFEEIRTKFSEKDQLIRERDAKVRTLEQQATRFQKEIATRKDDYDKLFETLIILKSEHSRETKTLASEKEDLLRRLAEKETSATLEKQENEKLSDTLKQEVSRSHSETISALKEQLFNVKFKLETEISRYREDIADVRNDIQGTKTLIKESFETQKENNEQQFRDLSDVIKEKADKIDELKTLEAEQEGKTKELNAKIATLIDETNRKELFIIEYKDTIDQLTLTNQHLNEEKIKLENNLKTEEQEHKLLVDQLTKTKREFDMQSEKDKRNIDTFKEKLRNSELKKTELFKFVDTIHKKIQNYERESEKEENVKLKSELTEFLNEVNQQSEEIITEQKLKSLEESVDTLIRNINKKEQEKVELSKLLEEEKVDKHNITMELKQNLQMIEKETKQKDADIKRLEGEQYKTASEKNSLQQQLKYEKDQHMKCGKELKIISEKHSNCDSTIQNVLKLKSEVETKYKRESKKLQAQIDTEIQKRLTIERQEGELKTQIVQLQSEYSELAAENQRTLHVLETLQARRVLHVQLYSSHRGDMLTGVETAIKKMLTEKLEKKGSLQIEFIQCAKQSDMLPNTPILLMCITASRLGTDVANVIQGLTLTSQMALLIFHHKDLHALPSTPSERVLTGKELEGIGGIFDMAFLAEKGMHNCQLNNNNLVNLVNFIKRNGVEKPLV